MKREVISKILVSICLMLVLVLALPLMSACQADKEYKIGITQIVYSPCLGLGS